MFSLTCALPRRTRTTAPGLPATGTSTACWMASAAAWAAIRFRVRSLIARAPRPPAGGGRNTSRRGRPAAAVAPGVASSVAELTGLELLRPESPGSKAPRSAGASGAPAVTVAPWSTDVAGRSARFRRPMPYRPTSPVRPATPPAETPQTRRTTRRSPTPSPSSVLWRPCSPSPLPTDGPVRRWAPVRRCSRSAGALPLIPPRRLTPRGIRRSPQRRRPASGRRSRRC